MNKEDKYTFLALPLLPVRLNALEAAWYLGFQPHEISILTGAGMLEPLGHPPANTPKFFSTESLAELRDNQKWLEKATDAISTYWRRKNGQKRAGRNDRTSPSSRPSPLPEMPDRIATRPAEISISVFHSGMFRANTTKPMVFSRQCSPDFNSF